MADKRSESKPQQPGAVAVGDASQQDASAIMALIRQLTQHGGIPIALSPVTPAFIDLGARLVEKPRRTVAFTPCADELLALIRTNDPDEITDFFQEYFKFFEHRIFGQYTRPPAPNAPPNTPPVLVELDEDLAKNLDPDLLQCGNPNVFESHTSTNGVGWPSDCCLCSACVTLDGIRNTTVTSPQPGTGIKRIFAGDLIWLFYFEQLGIFQILGVILDAYATTGRIPISNGAINVADVRDDITALVLEVMVRQTKMGLSSTVRDRAGAYRTCLGWNSTSGRKLRLDTEVNTGFNTLFHQFIFHALEFFNVRRMGVAIRGSAAPAPPPSVATLITISDTLDVLKRRLEVFDYGRNYYNTLSGIVWAIAGMSVIRELSTTLGIPPAFNEPHEFIPAAYDLLVLKRPVTSGTTNRYLVHRECAKNGRDILLDIEVVDHTKKGPGQELENWLTQIEAKVEAYRTAYRSLTGVDLGLAGTPAIEQQV